MRSFICILLLAAVAMATANDKPQYDINEAPALFEKFVKEHNRHYKDAADRQAHYEAFVESLKSINKSNAEQNGATFDINEFADYTPEEEKNLFGLKQESQETA